MAAKGSKGLVRVLPLLCGSLGVLTGLVVLAGWALNLPVLKTPVDGLPGMRAATAVSILLCGFAVALIGRVRHRHPAYAALAVACLIAGLSLAKGSAQPAVPDVAAVVDASMRDVLAPMAPLTSFLVLLLAAGTAARHRDSRLGIAAARVLAVCCLLLLGSSSLFYMVWAVEEHQTPLFWTMAPHTVAAVSLLSAGLLAACWTGRPASRARGHRDLRQGGVIAFALAFGAVGVLVWGFVTWTDYRETRADAEIKVSNLARVLEEHVRRSLDSADLMLRRLGEDVSVRGVETVASSRADWERIRALVDELPQISSVGILDARGDMLLLSTRFPLARANYAYRDYFAAHRAGANTFLGPLIVTGTTNKYAFTYSRRLSGQSGEFAGVLLATMELQYFLNFYQSLDLPDRASVGLFRVDGRPLVRHPLTPRLLGLDMSADPLFAVYARRAPSGIVVTRSPIDGANRLMAFRRADDLSLLTVATLDIATLVRGFEYRFLASGAVLTVVLLVLGLSVSQQIRAARREVEARWSVEASRDFAQSVMDSVAPHIAILDSRGRVVGTNSAWTRFAADNGAADPDAFLGRSYLDVCSAAEGEGAEDARAVASGIASVILGAAPTFEHLYPCHGGTDGGVGERRWFKLRVTPLRGSPGSVVVSHENVTDLKLAEEALQLYATTDALTGLANRRAFLEAAEREFAGARRSGRPLALLMLDCDRFKSVNDHHGHEAGDRVLQALAGVLRAGVRACDLPARFGGEEFVVLLPDTPPEGAFQLAERLRAAVAATAVETGWEPIRFTVSIGVGVAGRDMPDVAALLRETDAAMYLAKRQGRNRTEMAGGMGNLYVLSGAAALDKV